MLSEEFSTAFKKAIDARSRRLSAARLCWTWSGGFVPAWRPKGRRSPAFLSPLRQGQSRRKWPVWGTVVGNDTVLETEDLAKDFAGFVAVRGVNLRVARGSIHAMIGPNGAGKTTCFNLLSKFLSPTRGRIMFDGR